MTDTTILLADLATCGHGPAHLELQSSGNTWTAPLPLSSDDPSPWDDNEQDSLPPLNLRLLP